MRPPRIPATFSDSLPLSFSYSIQPGSKRVTLTIDAPEEWGSILMDGLSLLSNFAQQAKRTLEAGQREIRTQDTLSDLEAKYSTIQETYRALRASGLKHRAAVHALVSDSALPFHGVWKFSDFNACVRSRPDSSRRPVLRAVPSSVGGSR